jgi:hypothetical protein
MLPTFLVGFFNRFFEPQTNNKRICDEEIKKLNPQEIRG